MAIHTSSADRPYGAAPPVSAHGPATTAGPVWLFAERGPLGATAGGGATAAATIGQQKFMNRARPDFASAMITSPARAWTAPSV